MELLLRGILYKVMLCQLTCKTISKAEMMYNIQPIMSNQYII